MMVLSPSMREEKLSYKKKKNKSKIIVRGSWNTWILKCITVYFQMTGRTQM